MSAIGDAAIKKTPPHRILLRCGGLCFEPMAWEAALRLRPHAEGQEHSVHEADGHGEEPEPVSLQEQGDGGESDGDLKRGGGAADSFVANAVVFAGGQVGFSRGGDLGLLGFVTLSAGGVGRGDFFAERRQSFNLTFQNSDFYTFGLVVRSLVAGADLVDHGFV